MRHILDTSDLALIDSPEAFPTIDQTGLLSDAKRALRRIGIESHTDWQLDDPSLFQDGALFTCASVDRSASSTHIYFSKFGRLITVGRSGSPPYDLPSERILSLIELVEADYGFRFAHPSILNLDYSGVLSRYKIGTWYQRFFCSVYWTSGKAHQGVLQWI